MFIDKLYQLLKQALDIKKDWKKTADNGVICYSSRTASKSNYIMKTKDGMIVIGYCKRNVLHDAYSAMWRKLKEMGVFDRYYVNNCTAYRGVIIFSEKVYA